MRSCALAALLLSCTGCVAKPAPAPGAVPVVTTRVARSGAEGTTCPRVERAQRLWTGFLVDVPGEAMVRALDVVVPIQIALGALFCAPERADCRPCALQAIDLTDARADVARLRVLLARHDGARELSLTLQAQNETWSAQPESLARYLAQCRQGPSAELDAPPSEPTR